MKKIVGIIAALALASAVFADPELSLVPTSFKGDATLEWVADLDAETTGMQNGTSSEFKIVFIPETTKETSHDQDLWGELKIKVAKDEVAAAGSGINLSLPSVETAKIHFVDGDFYARLNILKPSLDFFGGNYAIATRSDAAPWSFIKGAVLLTDHQGFTFETGLTDLIAFNIQFADNHFQKSDDKEFAFVVDATLNGKGFDVEGLEVGAGIGYSTEELAPGVDQDLVFVAKASYKLGIDDKFYVRPSLGFGLQGDAKALTAALLFGWGAENIDSDYASEFSFEAGTKQIPKKFTDGVSFALTSDLESKDDGGSMGFIFGVSDSTFVPGLKWAADFQSDFYTIGDAWELNALAAYSNTFDIWTLDANFGLRVVKGAETNTGFLYGFGISTDNSIIQNTKLYIKYAGEHAKDLGAADNLKGKVTVGTQIHF